MKKLPEEFHWDGYLINLKCQKRFLLDALMPMPLKQWDTLSLQSALLPLQIENNVPWKQKLDKEKKLEHLPLELLWIPHNQFGLNHIKHYLKQKGEELLFHLPAIKESEQNILREQITELIPYYEIINTLEQISKETPEWLGLNQACQKQSMFEKESLQNVLSAIIIAFEKILQKSISPSLSLEGRQIQFFDAETPISLPEALHGNLNTENKLSEDFHFFLPDEIIRIFYSKLINLNLIEARSRLNEQIFQENIFKMAEFVLNTINHWLGSQEHTHPLQNNLPLMKNTLINPSQQLQIENHGSGSGFMIRCMINGMNIPYVEAFLFISTEICEIFENQNR